MQVHGTVFETAIDNGQTSVATSEGVVEVTVGDERVSVPGGQLVRAQAQRVSERGPVQPAGSLTIDAPFTGALVSERGEATGARPDGADPLAANLALGAPVGLLGIELDTRRRNRMNGVLAAQDEHGFTVEARQSFGNCPQYIQLRDFEFLNSPLRVFRPGPALTVDLEDRRVRAGRPIDQLELVVPLPLQNERRRGFGPHD